MCIRDRLESVSQVYASRRGTVTALAAVDLAVGEGEFVCLRGPSGSGKSTLLFVLGAMLQPSSGRVRVAGRELAGLGARGRAALRAEHVGFVFQSFHLLPYLDALGNLLVAGAGRRGRAPRRRAEELLERVGLGGRAEHRPAELSAGERQRLALARALVNEPALVLADEPTGNLDPASAAAVLELLGEAHREGRTVVLVTHGRLAAGLAERTLHLREGRLEEPA